MINDITVPNAKWAFSDTVKSHQKESFRLSCDNKLSTGEEIHGNDDNIEINVCL